MVKLNIREQAVWLIPVLAVLVIFQAVVLSSQSRIVSQKIGPYVPVPTIESVPKASASLAFVPAGVSFKKGETVKVDLVLTPKRALHLDGVDIVMTFDPEVLQITQVATPKLFSYVSQNKDKEKEGRIALTFLEEKAGGLLVGSEVKLLTLTVKGKASGTSELSLLVSERGPTTVITESGTSQQVLFDRGSLKVVIN